MDFKHDGPNGLRLGLVVAENVAPRLKSSQLDTLLAERLSALQSGLTEAQDAFRASVRDVFRNGSYKPTGRAKPASEYLLRAAAESRFPRINTLVDCCNYLSAASLLPISIWDLDLAEGTEYSFRLGREDESYAFNNSGQSISLKDLIVGCVADSEALERPIVNAVKDSMATKTHDATTRIAAAIYAPLHEGPDLALEEVCSGFAQILGAADSSPTDICTTVDHKIIFPGEIASF